MAESNWEPFARGSFYGSPACCGARLCTRKAFDQATAEANVLAVRMGPGWSTVVWENLGWYYKIQKGPVRIYVNIDGSPTKGGWKVKNYWCDLFGANSGSEWQDIPQFHATADTPEDALGFATQAARTCAQRIADGLRDILA